jgi:hypothetical protein
MNVEVVEDAREKIFCRDVLAVMGRLAPEQSQQMFLK